MCLIELFHKKEIPVMLVEEKCMYINYVDSQVVKVQTAISTEVPEIGEYSGNLIYQAIAYIDKGMENDLSKILPNCRITRWNPFAVDIISGSGGKINGIQQYLLKNQISRHEIMAFGDGENDMEMLRFAEVGIAMGNAEEKVKACADYVTASVDEDGIEKALNIFCNKLCIQQQGLQSEEMTERL